MPGGLGEYSADMDEGQKLLWKVGAAIFAILIAGAWIWSWLFPEDPNRYLPRPSPVVTQAPAGGSRSPSLYSDPCEDEITVEDYKSCMEDQAIEDWRLEQEGNTGLP